MSPPLASAVLESTGHPHEHVKDPVKTKDARHLAPLAPGYGAEMHPASLERFAFPPGGPEWRT